MSKAHPVPAADAPCTGGRAEDVVPSVLADVRSLTAVPEAPAGAVWKLAETGRQLDANVVHLPPRRRVDTHAERDLDVLLLVVGGDGTLVTAEGPRPLTEGSLLWLPHGSRRSLSAGENGLYYLTVHPRRPGLRIQRWEPSDGDAGAGADG
ncbi:hypothetical protein [Streptomyces sp. NPDC003077]|uniref:cupin domain-containing protein n=1 Tax=Streptomyces sp. NPDC003077 TaxID=3154443 RepID=UPI0033BE1A82